MTSAKHRSVARILFWWHDHMPRAHNIHVMYNSEHHSDQVAAEWGVCVVIADVRHTVNCEHHSSQVAAECVVIADVRHTVQNIYFSTSVQKLLTLLFSPFTQTWLTIWPSKKYKSHTDINIYKNQPLLSTFLAHLLALSHTHIHTHIYIYIYVYVCVCV